MPEGRAFTGDLQKEVEIDPSLPGSAIRSYEREPDSILCHRSGCLRMAMGAAPDARGPRTREWLIVLAIFAAALTWRTLTVTPVHRGGDATYKWAAIKRFVTSGTLPDWDHQTMRWGSNLPVLAVQGLFGVHPSLYYAFPVLCGALLPVLAYLLGRELHSRLAGVVAALAVLFYSAFHWLAPQFLPDVPRALWLMLCVYLVLRWRKGRQLGLTFLAGTALLVAYGAKVTALYYAPPIAFFIMMESNRWRLRGVQGNPLALKSLLVFCLPLFVGIALETVTLYLLTGYPYGRALYGNRFHSANLATYVERVGLLESGVGRETFWGWVTSFTDYMSFGLRERVLLIGGVFCSAFVLIRRLKRARLLALCFLAGLSLQTWMVTSVSPYVFAQQRYGRFYSFLFVQAIVLFVVLGVMLCERLRLTATRRGWAVALIPLATFILALMPHTRFRIWEEVHIPDNPIRVLAADVKLIAQARQQRVPVAIEIPISGWDRDLLCVDPVAAKYVSWYEALFADGSALPDAPLSRLAEERRVLYDTEKGRALLVMEEGKNEERTLVGQVSVYKRFRFESEPRRHVRVRKVKLQALADG